MLEIAVCDDNLNDLRDITQILQVLFSQQNIDCHIKSFLSANELMDYTKKIDIGILDIVMDEQNGIDLGRKLKEKFPDIRLIYTTSYEQYVMQAINDVHAYSYLCKPIDHRNMHRQMMELLSSFSQNSMEKIFYHVTDSNQREYASVTLNVKEILYFQYIKRQRRVAVVMENATYEYDAAFENVAEEFEQFGFAVNRRGELVNLSHVVKIEGYTVYLDNEQELSISQLRIARFREELNEFLQKNS